MVGGNGLCGERGEAADNELNFLKVQGSAKKGSAKSPCLHKEL